MNQQITPQQALQNLYFASRKATLTADEHDIIKKCAQILNDIINPADKKEEPRTNNETNL